MAKPSIFSSDYEKSIRRRRKNIILSIVIVVLVILIAMVVFFGDILPTGKTSNDKTKKTNSTAINKKTEANSKKKNETTQKVQVPVNFVVAMPSGKQIKIDYKLSGTTKIITNAENTDADLEYNISPSGSAVVIFQKSTQDMMLAASDGTTTNITSENYTAGNGQVFDKANVLKTNASYIWCASPRFIDDNNIAYITQLPWFNKTNKYIWKYNLQSKTSINTNITGQNVQINNINPKGLEIVVDGATEYINAAGNITK